MPPSKKNHLKGLTNPNLEVEKSATKSLDLLPHLAIVAESHDIDTGDTTYVIRIPTAVGVKEVSIPRQDFEDLRGAMSFLARKGCNVPKPEIDRWYQSDSRNENAEIIRTTSVAGWYGDTLVTRHGIFGMPAQGSIKFVSDERYCQHHASKGDLETNVSGLRPFFEKSTYLGFAYLVALLPPLAQRAEVDEGFSICFAGKSGSGKTTLQLLIQSLSARANGESEIVPWIDTKGKFIESVATFFGLATCFSDPKGAPESHSEHALKLKSLSFSGSLGFARHRAGSSSAKSSATTKGFNLYVFAAEQPLKAIYEQAKVELEDGDRIRIIDIAIPTPHQGGIFPGLGQEARKRLASSFAEFRSAHHGNIVPAFAAHLSRLSSEEIKHVIDTQRAAFDAAVGYLDTFSHRLSRIFVLLWATAAIAADANLLPLQVTSFHDATLQIFRVLIGEASAKRAREKRTRTNWLKFLISRKNLPLLARGKVPKARLNVTRGFQRDEEDYRYVYVKTSAFRDPANEVENKEASEFLDWLMQQQLHERPGGRGGQHGENTRHIKQKGIPKQRYLAFKKGDLKTLLSRVTADEFS